MRRPALTATLAALAAAAALVAALAPAAPTAQEPPPPAVAPPAAAPPAAAPPADALPAISVAPVAKAALRDRVIASGGIAAVERVFVAPRIEGQPIEELRAEVGDRVQAGEVLAVLSDAALTLSRAQLTASRAATLAGIAQAGAAQGEARAAAAEAVRVRDRQAALLARGVGAQAAADQADAQATAALARVTVAEHALAAAEAQLALADAQIAVADLNLARTQVTAPVAGVIVERNAAIGAIASAAGNPMFVIIRDGALELRADVAAQDVLRLAPGQTATLRVVGAEAPVAGIVHLVEPAVDAQTRLGRVRIALTDPAAVRPGLFAQAEIVVAAREAAAVPITAVSTEAGEAAVYRVSPAGEVRRVRVRTGIRDGARVEIVEGLSEGDLVVARAGAFVRDGDRINPVMASDRGAQR